MDGTTAQAIEIELAKEAIIQVGFKRLSPDAVIPTKAHASDSGFDLVASADVIIEPGETVVVPTGIAVQLPAGYEATVRPRSGVTSKTKLRVQLGTIDNGYVGDIGVIVDNVSSVWRSRLRSYPMYLTGKKALVKHGLHASGTYLIRKGDRIAQLVITRLPDVEAVEVFDVGETQRGANGFGSSGV
ncbi:dUTP diphosphatase [Sporosarcina psychrophila]|uniref:dUTP diphosphatase n=1 Tax=Sporosarcina psychrophila TaxID=1476 RepID=A0ABV2KBN7_SPOPS